MLRLLLRGGMAAAFICLFALAAPMAQAKHDSNSLDKFGRAIQYPFRKGAENTSITIHRAEGRKSVVHRRNATGLTGPSSLPTAASTGSTGWGITAITAAELIATG